jgi:ATP-dependent DNA helicase RecQ
VTESISTEQEFLTDAADVLKRHWGHDSFRPGQVELIEAVLSGRDAFGVLPTGAGKSVCYQLPAIMLDGMTLVISPLIALMEDQVRSLNEKGISAATLSGGTRKRPWDAVLNDARFGRYKILFVSPERLVSDAFRAQIHELNIALVAVDEAHCISEWGHEFRPEYYQIADLYEKVNSNGGPEQNRPPVIAVTATATPVVRNDIKKRLRLKNPVEVLKSFDRPNLSFSVFTETSKYAKVRNVLQSVSGSGIIYAPTRKGVETWGRQLTSSGIQTEIYHAGLSSAERTQSQYRWISGQSDIIVATNAFGMGVDKSDVRFVIHVGLPMSMEAYYQEAGRAGRDGNKAYATMIADQKDIKDRQSMISDVYPESGSIRAVYDALLSINGVAIGDRSEHPFEADYDAMKKATGLSDRRISAVIEHLVRSGVLFRNSVSSPARIQKLDELPRSRIEGARRQMYELREPRSARLEVDRNRQRRLRKAALGRLGDVIKYVKVRDCRRKHIVGHFDDFSIDTCGMCDNCLGRHDSLLIEPHLNDIMIEILRTLAEKNTVYDVGKAGHFPRYRVDEMIDWLAIQGYVELADDPTKLPTVTAAGVSVALR